MFYQIIQLIDLQHLSNSVKEMYHSGTEDQRELVEEFMSRGNSRIYITRKDNPHYLLLHTPVNEPEVGVHLNRGRHVEDVGFGSVVQEAPESEVGG